MNSTTELMNPLLERREQSKPATNLRPFFAPQAVAVIGASPKPGNLGRRIVDSLRHQGYPGRVYTVHPRGEPISPHPVVKQVEDLPCSVELAIAAVSAPQVPGILRPLADKGIRHLIIISGGFSETGPEGEVLQNQVRETARELGIRLIGPNGLGVFSAPDRFNSFFLVPGGIQLPREGPVAIISQSGAFMSQMLDGLATREVGVHRAVNFGNRIDIGENELLEEFERDPAVKLIGIYLESVGDGQRFFEIARRVARTKPIVICKGGRSQKGFHAARAHSASLAGSYEVFSAACAQAGLIEVQGLEELIDALQVLAAQPPAKSNRVLIVSNGGGMGVLLSDLCEQAGLSVPETSRYYQDYLRGLFPGYYSFRNPVDLTGSGTNEQCVQAIQYLLETREFDSLLLVLLSGTEGINSDIATLLKNRLPGNIPVVMGVYGRSFYESTASTLKKENIPVFDTGEKAAWALRLLVTAGEKTRKPAGMADLRGDMEFAPMRERWGTHETVWHEMLIKQKMAQCGIPVPQNLRLASREDLARAIDELGFPMALKVSGPELKHKTDFGALRLHLKTEAELLKEWNALQRKWPGQVWAEQEMPDGLDLMVGTHRDPQFGPVLVFGTGGTYVEVYQDVARLLLPATDAEFLQLIYQTKAGTIIAGARGHLPLDVNRLIAFLKWTADWMLHEPEIESLDFNPVRLYKNDLVVLDAKVTPARNYKTERGEDL